MHLQQGQIRSVVCRERKKRAIHPVGHTRRDFCILRGVTYRQAESPPDMRRGSLRNEIEDVAKPV